MADVESMPALSAARVPVGATRGGSHPLARKRSNPHMRLAHSPPVLGGRISSGSRRRSQRATHDHNTPIPSRSRCLSRTALNSCPHDQPRHQSGTSAAACMAVIVLPLARAPSSTGSLTVAALAGKVTFVTCRHPQLPQDQLALRRLRRVGEDRGYAVSNLDALGDGPGFRKIRSALGVDAFGINAIVLPPGYSTGVHFHDEQQELYFVHRGEVEIRFGDGSTHRLGPGGLARVDASTHRGLRNVGQTEAVLVIAGGKNGYVGRDGQAVDSDGHPIPAAQRSGPPGMA